MTVCPLAVWFRTGQKDIHILGFSLELSYVAIRISRMTAVVPDTSIEQAFGLLDEGLAALGSAELFRLSEDELLEALRRLESFRRRLPVVDHALVGELEQRHLAERVGARSTAMLLRDVLRLSPREATSRVRAAGTLGVRETITGEVLPPEFPVVAAAQAAGVVSAEQARVITGTIRDLPVTVRAEHGESVEQTLVEEAGRFDPDTLAKLARRVAACLDPDGTLASDDDQQRRRTAALTSNRDGSGELQAHLTPAALARLQAVLSPLAKPRPASDSGRDERTPGQRLHDAIDDMAARLLRSGTLPASGGTPATVLLTMTLDQLESRTGLVTTGHGGQLSVCDALRLAGDADVIPVVISSDGVLGYGRARRTASAAQRRAITARDGGCVMPGCDHPPDWCETHHLIRWDSGGRTDIDSLVLLCGYHHDHYEAQGWAITMIDGRAWAIPPPWIDPEQQPICNRMHDKASAG